VPDSVPEERLEALGLTLYEEGERTLIDAVNFRSAAERAGLQFDQEILELQMETHRPPKEIMWIPAVLLLGLMGWLQLRRARAQQLPQTLF
jgi:hypothetical protein